MHRTLSFWILLVLLSITVKPCSAQEEESAELFLEEYNDEFQEHFFEALKQKSIQNYDRAINLFLTCQQLDPSNDVIDFQLAKTYFLDKQYIQAQEYALEALAAKPDDFWYVGILVEILGKQGRPFETIEERIPMENTKLQENLALTYFKNQNYEDALAIVETMGDSKFASSLSLKIRDSLALKRGKEPVGTQKIESVQKENPVDQYKSEMEMLLGRSDYTSLEALAQKALEAYPLQPYFHYAYGAALNGTKNTAKSIEVLEGALDYLLEEGALANKIFQELAKAYTTIGNTSKANEYLNKVKSGL